MSLQKLAPLITPAAAEATMIRWQCAGQARRLSLAIAWQRYTPREALREMKVAVLVAAEAARCAVACGSLARSMLAEAVATLEDSYAVTAAMIERTVFAGLQRGLSRTATTADAVELAITADPPLPPQYVQDAVDRASRTHHWRTASQSSTGRSAAA